jgi:hypothetical protein
MAFMHGGMWVAEELKQTYCARCRRTVAVFWTLVAGVVLTAASFGVGLWLRGL